MPDYIVTFDRIGRDKQPPVMEVTAPDHFAVLDQIYKFARPRLRSNDIDVCVDDDGTGTIFCGAQVGATFKVSDAKEID
jgi:hypothetical protein